MGRRRSMGGRGKLREKSRSRVWMEGGRKRYYVKKRKEHGRKEKIKK